VPPVPFSNVSGDWSVPLIREVYTRLAGDLELILYDGRGTGASHRTVTDLSLDVLTTDLEAVLDASGVEEASLLALYLAAGPAVDFAARRPERVGRMLLFGATPDGSKVIERPGTAALLSLIDEDWELFTRTAALDWMGWGVGEAGHLVAESFRSATTPEVARAAMMEFARTDLRPLLNDVQAETLVLHRREGRQVPLDVSAALASALPNGRLHVLEGSSATLFFDDPAGTADLISAFVRPGGRARQAARGAPPSSPLSEREREVLGLLAAGESNAEIAYRLGISIHTVERHVANVYRKIDARGRADATAWALRHGLG